MRFSTQQLEAYDPKCTCSQCQKIRNVLGSQYVYKKKPDIPIPESKEDVISEYCSSQCAGCGANHSLQLAGACCNYDWCNSCFKSHKQKHVELNRAQKQTYVNIPTEGFAGGLGQAVWNIQAP